MSKFLAILKMVPGILTMVVAVEHAVTAPKSGPTKLDLVVGTVGVAAELTPEIAGAIGSGDIQTATALIAGAAVTAFNIVGMFKKAK